MLNIGWASRDVSEQGPVLVTGQAHQRISAGVKDSTTVTALVMEEKGEYAVFVSGDFTFIEGAFLAEVKAAAQERIPGFDGEKLIFHATHTHTAPRYMLHMPGYDRAPTDRVEIFPPAQYRAFLRENVVDAIEEAWTRRKPGSFSYGYGTASVGQQRRVTYFTDRGAGNKKGDSFAVNGHGVMYGNTNDPDFDSYEGPTDSNVNLLFTFDEQEKLTGAIINVPCPSQCTEQEYFTSADYWNEVRQLLRQEYGNIYILPQCAAAGDLSPHPLHDRQAWERRLRLKYGDFPEGFIQPKRYWSRRDLAERIAAAFTECYRWAKEEKFSRAPIAHTTKILELERWQVSEEAYLDAKGNYGLLQKEAMVSTDDPQVDYKQNTILGSNLRRYEQVMENYERREQPVATKVHVVRVGDLAFFACPFELFLAYQHRIQARSPAVQTFVVELTGSDTGESFGYLPTRRAAENKGYSAIVYSCSVSPAGGQALVEETVKELQNLWGK